MQSGATLYWQYGTSKTVGIFNSIGNTGIYSRREKGCEATVTIQNGKVSDVKPRPFGGILTGPLACQRLFAECGQ